MILEGRQVHKRIKEVALAVLEGGLRSSVLYEVESVNLETLGGRSRLRGAGTHTDT